jgi:hypothetical protein
MRHLLQRHPFAVEAFFRHTLVLTYAFPSAMLERLLPPGLVLDTWHDHGFLAVALVQTERLRPARFPAALGRDFFLSGYRIFARSGTRRGLCILRSDTDRSSIVIAGNLLTHYRYVHCQADIEERGGVLRCRIRTPLRDADLDVSADLTGPAALPPGSPFATACEARRFAGPLPYTFSYEPETRSIIRVQGVRSAWDPQPVAVEVRTATFFERPPFDATSPLLAAAFHVRNVPYRWERGVRTEAA